ncbi:hypothetical protein HY989_02025 [Candidatus Micrarchaeota archaeon]|nr:hypothetical protein [Candidatus Micrarchaeota archaeon]
MANGEERKKSPSAKEAIQQRLEFHAPKLGFKHDPILLAKLNDLLHQEEHPYNPSLGTARKALQYLRQDLFHNEFVTNEHLLHIAVDALSDNPHHGLTGDYQKMSEKSMNKWLSEKHRWDPLHPTRIPKGMENITKKQFLLWELEKKFDSKGGKAIYAKNDALDQNRVKKLETYLAVRRKRNLK